MRYIPYVGTNCRIELIPKFAKLSGVYNIIKSISYTQAMEDDIDFRSTLYTPAGLDSDQYDLEYKNYIADEIIVVKNPDGDVYNIFSSLLVSIPDPTVKLYGHSVITCTLGFYDDVSKFSWVVEEIEEILKGISDTTGDVRIISASPKFSRWLTDDEYATLDKKRSENLKQIDPLIVRYQTLQSQHNELKLKYAALQNHVISLSTKTDNNE